VVQPLLMLYVSTETTTFCTIMMLVIKTAHFLDVTKYTDRWVRLKCWCQSSKLYGVTSQNITMFSLLLSCKLLTSMPLKHHIW
jgi:hypothetical protein